MADRFGADIFEVYSKASRAWLDSLGYWARAAGPATMAKGMDVEGWFKPYREYLENWNKAYSSYASMMNAAFSFPTIKDTSDLASKSMSSYTKIYNQWFEGMGAITREAYEIGRQVSSGEKVGMEKLFDSVRSTYDNVSSLMMESMQETPFAGMKEIENSIMKSLDAFPEEQKILREFLEELVSMGTRTMNLSASTVKQTTEGLGRIMEKGSLSGNGYKSMIADYEETLKESIKAFSFPYVSVPGYKEITEQAMSWAKANIDLYVSWFEMNLKLYHGISGSTGEVTKAAEALFKNGEASSTEEFYKRWGESWKNATNILVKNSQFYENVPAFISSYTNWIKATNDFCRAIVTVPYASREDLERISEELEKLKRSAEKKAKSKIEEAKVGE